MIVFDECIIRRKILFWCMCVQVDAWQILVNHVQQVSCNFYIQFSAQLNAAEGSQQLGGVGPEVATPILSTCWDLEFCGNPET